MEKETPIERQVRLIRCPEELRRVLLDSIVRVIEGKMNVTQANAVVGLSAEVHKSVRQQWEMETYAADNLAIGAMSKIVCIEQDDGC